jgi:hypothetical protein
MVEVVVAHKDRLARFGTELIEWILKQAGATLVVLDKATLSPTEEVTQDLMAIVHVFSCRLNGKRKYKSFLKKSERLTRAELYKNLNEVERARVKAALDAKRPQAAKRVPDGGAVADPQATSVLEGMVQGRTMDLQPGVAACH